jgi:hypothetical protein
LRTENAPLEDRARIARLRPIGESLAALKDEDASA